MTEQYFQKYTMNLSINIKTSKRTSGCWFQYVTNRLSNTIKRKKAISAIQKTNDKKEFFKKYEYVYDEHLDIYICPNEKDLHYVTTNRKGYRIYKSDSKDCEGYPFLSKYTKSKNHGIRFTRLKGLERNQHESLIIFSCHNLKKLGLNKRRLGLI